MRKTICTFLAALLFCSVLPFAAAQPALAATDYSQVRVLLGNSGTNVTSIGATVRGNYFIQENGLGFSNGTLTISVQGNQLAVSHSTGGVLYTGSSVRVMREQLAPNAGSISMVVGGRTRSYLGHFLFKYYNGGIRVINTVPLQHYLYGVVAFEMSNAFPIEALKAQAVAAKCYVLSGMAPSSDYDIGDTASDQVYKGYSSGDTAVIQAVDATFDVWLYLGNSILCSYFAASNGGQTALPSDVWGGTNRYLWDKAYGRVEDPYDIANPLTVQETAFFPANGDNGRMAGVLSNYLRLRTAGLLRGNGQIPASSSVVFINAINKMQITGSKSAIIGLNVTVQGQDGSSQAIDFSYEENLDLFYYNGIFTRAQTLRLYTVEQVNGGFQLRRCRYGHGVGLSQRGAEQMANSGWDYQRILRFYYPGASFKNMGLNMPADPARPGGTGAAPNNGASGATNPAPGSPIATAITTGTVNFRAGPSASTTNLGSIPKGTKLDIYGQESGFSQTIVNGTVGYLSNTYLSITPLTSPDTNTNTGSTGSTGSDATVTSYGEVSSNTLNFRDKPNTGGKVLQTLKKGDKLDIYGYADTTKSWYYCASKGISGYVSAQYVKITGQATGSDASGSASGTSMEGNGTVNADKTPLLAEASSKAKIDAYLQQGLQVTILTEQGDYYYISINSYAGYVEKKYITPLNASVPSSGSSGSTGGAATAGVTTGSVNFRTGPATKYSKIKNLKKGTALEILGSESGWYKVKVDGKTGYVSGDYVKVTNSSGTSSSGTSTGVKAWLGVVKNGGVRLRSTPSSSSDSNIIAEISAGTSVVIYHIEGSFYKVSVGSQEGYMHVDYVNVTSETTLAAGSSSSASAITNSKVNLRAAADMNATILTTLSKGTTVTVLKTEGDWYYAKVGEKTGYLYRQYVSVSGGSAGSSATNMADSTKTGITTGNVNMRSSANSDSSANLITQLKKGTTVTIHGLANGWYHVSADGQKGYVSAKYVKENK